MRLSRIALFLLFPLLLTLAVGCQSDTPSEPSGSGTTIPPQAPPQTVTYNITVTPSPAQLAAGSSTSSTITVQVRRSDNGQVPPDLTPLTLTTTLGDFGSFGSGVRSLELQLVNGQAQAVLFPGTNAGTATVRAQVDSSAGAANIQIGTQATFFVSSVSPGVGSPQGGEEVTINGGGFDGPVRVTFNGAAAQVRSVTPDRIRVLTPSAVAAGVDVGVGQSAPVTVSVTINVNEQGSATDSLANGFTYALGTSTQQPQFFSISPASGSNDGGTTATIVGTGFQAPVQVFFGNGTVTSFTGIEATVQSVTPNQIIVTTPAARGFGLDNVNQTVDILIRNQNTGFATVATDRFTYGTDVLITAVGPGIGDFRGGTTVTIQGQGFDDPVAVSLGGIGQTVLSVTGTQIVVRTSGILLTTCPASGFVQVTNWRVVNIETGDFDDAPELGFQYTVPLPQIFGINPSSGNPGTTTATITGTNFSSNVQVLFGDATNGAAAQVLSTSPTSISIRVPNPPTGFTFNTEPCDGNGDGNPGGTRNVATPISVTVRNLDGTNCVTTLSNVFTLNPPNTTCTGDTTTPPPAPQCSDGIDNDGDGRIDFNANPALGDPQCTSPADNSEAT